MLTLSTIYYSTISGRREYTIGVSDEHGNEYLIVLPLGVYDKSTIVNELIRSKYSQDQVEAIINNHFIAIAEWIDSRLNNGSTEKFVDEEYETFQLWRVDCKSVANNIVDYIANDK